MHALVAFGTLYEGCCRKDVFDTPNLADEPCFQSALKQYNTAIARLHARLSGNSPGSAGAALLSCIILGSFELLQGNGNAALLHLESGLRILRSALDGTSGGCSQWKEDVIQASEFDDVIIPLFARLDLQASSYVSQRPTQLQMHSRGSRVFSSSEQARDDLTSILSTIYHFLATEAQLYKYCHDADIPPDVEEERRRLIVNLDQWRKTFDVLLSNASVGLTYAKLVGAIILKIQHRAAAILLAVCLSAAEESYDDLESSFLEIILLCGTVTGQSTHSTPPSTSTYSSSCSANSTSSSSSCSNLSRSPRTPPVFAIEMGIIHPLYLTAQKCRTPWIRRRAIELLAGTGREGVWDGPFRARVAQRIIELEEVGPVTGGKIPEHARIHQTCIKTDRATGRRWLHVTWAKDADFQEWVEAKEPLSSFLNAEKFLGAQCRQLSAPLPLPTTENGRLRLSQYHSVFSSSS